jgi:Zn-dependent peptidase ImmA (M78 family)
MIMTSDGAMMMSEYNLEHEEEADCFGATLLLPRDALLDVLSKGISDIDAAHAYNVSPQLYRMRRNTTGVDRQLSYRSR